jgi:hypothetical protein
MYREHYVGPNTHKTSMLRKLFKIFEDNIRYYVYGSVDVHVEKDLALFLSQGREEVGLRNQFLKETVVA